MNIQTLNRYYEDGLLYKQTHPTLPLTIWNYNEKVQYEGLWDEVTAQCRGLITENTTGKILVRPFKKFHNDEEVVGKGVIPSQGDYVYIQEKMDGSLGILFNYEDQWIMATRGSFASEQAIKGLEIVKSKYFLASWSKEYAYLVEIIYEANRIVVRYDEEKIVFLSVVLNESWKWEPTDDTELHWTTANFSDELYKSLKQKNETNKEGFVLRFQPGNFRMKIKFEEYVRLHKVMTNLSTTAVWEVLSSGASMDDLLKDVPDEFYQKIKQYENELTSLFNLIVSDYFIHFRTIQSKVGDVSNNRAKFALFAKQYQYPSILFAMLDGKDIAPIISKIIKPEFRKL